MTFASRNDLVPLFIADPERDRARAVVQLIPDRAGLPSDALESKCTAPGSWTPEGDITS
jgi:hypothetical protein